MGLAKPVPSSVAYTHMDIPKRQYTPPLIQKEENRTVIDKSAEGEVVNTFTQEEALEYMDITETEFLELLIETGNCPTGKLDKNRVYPKELIFKIDPEKWADPKIYTFEEAYGEIANSTYTLGQALEILNFTESELKEQLVENKFCTAEEFERIEEFPFLWLRVIDPYKGGLD